MELPLAVGGNYKVTFKARSTVARTIKASVMAVSGDKYAWLSGSDVLLKENDENEVTYYIKNVPATMKVDGVDVDIAKANKGIFFSMGMITDEGYIAEDTPASTIEISDLSVTKVETTGTDSQSNPGTKPNHATTDDEDVSFTIGSGMLENTTISKNLVINKNVSGAGSVKQGEGSNSAEIIITNPGAEEYAVMVAHNNITLQAGHTYKYSFKVKVDSGTWSVRSVVSGKDGAYIPALAADQTDTITTTSDVEGFSKEFTPTEGSEEARFALMLGNGSQDYAVKNDMDGRESVKITITEFKMEDITESNILPTFYDEKWIKWGSDKPVIPTVKGDYEVEYIIKSAGDNEWDQKLELENIDLGVGTYSVSFDIISDKAYTIKGSLRDVGNSYKGWYSENTELEAGKKLTVNGELVIDGVNNLAANTWDFIVLMGKMGANDSIASEENSVTITISNVKIIKK